MAVSIVDGTIEEAALKWSRRGISLFTNIRFRLADGSERTVKKAVVKQEVADELVPGARGRFYLFKAFDVGGVHGVRTADGREVYGFPGNNQKIFLISGIVSSLWIVVMIASRDAVPMLGVALLIFSTVGWHFMSKGRREAETQFNQDGGGE